MHNQIDAHIEFSYQGKSYALATTLDLDSLDLDQGNWPDFHRLLAQAHGIDTYSYLYEVMESHDIEFAHATGIAADYLHDGGFDAAGFHRRRQQLRELAVLGPIAQRHLQVTDLDGQPALKQALLDAYHAGKNSRA